MQFPTRAERFCLPDITGAWILRPAEHVAHPLALAAMPPLEYLSLGTMVGDGAFVGRNLGATDVLIVPPVENINGRYLNHYGIGAEHLAATQSGEPAAASGWN